ncbi:MAG TPA: hypothetical protein VGM18_15830 [Candidatus Sulfotelmatobacter sp.]|jgi:hypothetical protein
MNECAQVPFLIRSGSDLVSIEDGRDSRERLPRKTSELVKQPSVTLYNQQVARGWESKSVEAQQEEASEKPSPSRGRMSAEEAAQWREKEILRLARQRVLQQLETTENSRHRKLLEDSLIELDGKLKK